MQEAQAVKTIILADDEPKLRSLVKATLEAPHYRIVEASDGTAAWDLVQAEAPDVVILDWMMPGLSGIDVARRIRQHPSTAVVPIIMLTARSQAKDREAGESIGINAYLVKPFSPLQLMREVDRVLSESAA
jgi:two-component system phosphate regulon response regulator PhoB